MYPVGPRVALLREGLRGYSPLPEKKIPKTTRVLKVCNKKTGYHNINCVMVIMALPKIKS